MYISLNSTKQLKHSPSQFLSHRNFRFQNQCLHQKQICKVCEDSWTRDTQALPCSLLYKYYQNVFS